MLQRLIDKPSTETVPGGIAFLGARFECADGPTKSFDHAPPRLIVWPPTMTPAS